MSALVWLLFTTSSTSHALHKTWRMSSWSQFWSNQNQPYFPESTKKPVSAEKQDCLPKFIISNKVHLHISIAPSSTIYSSGFSVSVGSATEWKSQHYLHNEKSWWKFARKKNRWWSRAPNTIKLSQHSSFGRALSCSMLWGSCTLDPWLEPHQCLYAST